LLLQGPPRAISASVLVDKPNPTFYTGSFDGTVRAFELPSGNCSAVEGSQGDGQVTGFAVDPSEADGKLWSTGWGPEGGLQAIDNLEFE
jgi:WD40 repeat protein